MIARPSYGGEREPDSHPTPGPPTFVQSARVQLVPLRRSSAAEQPGGCPFSGYFPGVHLAGRPVESDLAPAGWLAARLPPPPPPPPAPPTVAALVPPVFAAYARVLHPAIRYDGDDDVEVRWSA